MVFRAPRRLTATPPAQPAGFLYRDDLKLRVVVFGNRMVVFGNRMVVFGNRVVHGQVRECNTSQVLYVDKVDDWAAFKREVMYRYVKCRMSRMAPDGRHLLKEL